MVQLHEPKAKKSKPASGTRRTNRDPTRNKSRDENLLPDQEELFQRTEITVLVSELGQEIRCIKKLTLDGYNKIYYGRGLRLQEKYDLAFAQNLRDFIDDAEADAEASEDLELENCLAESERARNTPGSTDRRRSMNPVKRSILHPTTPSTKRRRSSTQCQAALNIEEDEGEETPEPDDYNESAYTVTQEIRYDQLREKFYTPAFQYMGQLACKDVGRSWIKMGHPKKQSQFPYNGGATSARSMAHFNCKGQFTKPDWWPSFDGWELGFGCRHIEPDHQRKLERIFLLKHLLYYGGQFVLEKMKESTGKIAQEYPKNWTREKVAMLEQIYRVRKEEMRYETGEIDVDATINVPIPKQGKNESRNAPKAAQSSRPENERTSRGHLERTPSRVAIVDMGPTKDEETAVSMVETTDETEPSFITDTNSPTTKAISDEIDVLPTLYEDRGPPHGLPLPDPALPVREAQTISSKPTRQRHTTIRRSACMQQNLNQLAANQNGNLVIDSTLPRAPPQQALTPAITPNHIPTARKERNTMPVQDSYQSSMAKQSSYRYGCEMRVPHRPQPCNLGALAAMDMTLKSPPGRPRAPAFAASSPGLAGLEETDEASWNNNNIWSPPRYGMNGAIYNFGADPHAQVLMSAGNPSSVDTSFSSDMTDDSTGSIGSGFATDDWDHVDEMYPQQVQSEQLGQQYLASGFNTLSVQSTPYMYVPSMSGDMSVGYEPKYNPYGQGQPRDQ